jgi:hypothetical protein
MLRIIMLLVICSLSLMAAGCSDEKRPKADPNFKVATDPSTIDNPLMKTKPQAPKP